MIARDEAGHIADCLRSVADLVDEMIVVDTGSQDETPSLAREAGAKVVAYAWRDDFADARNTSLAAATGDWVLVLDADERLATGHEAIRALIDREDVDCGLIPLHNAVSLEATQEAVLSGEARLGEAVLLPRLLRRTADLQYRSVIHESVGEWLAGREHRVQAVSAAIVHYGSVLELRRVLGKDDRNLRLLERRVAEEPDSPVALTYLGIEYVRVGRIEEAEAVLARAWSAVVAAMAGDGQRPTFVSLATLRMQLLIARGDLDEAMATADQAVAWGSSHPNLDFFAGRTWELMAARAARTVEAQRFLLRAGARYCACLDKYGRVYPEEVHQGITGWLGQVRLGTVLLQVGEFEDALAAFDQALAANPAQEDALLGRVEALIRLDRADAALAELEPLLGGPGPDAWLLAYLATRHLGMTEDAEVFRAVARERRQEAFYAPHRAAWLNDAEMPPSRGAPVSVPPEPTPPPDSREDFVFVGGAGRSGTTLFRAMLHAHQSFYCGPELKLVTVLGGLRDQWLRTMGADLEEAGVTQNVLDASCAAFVGTLLRQTATPGLRVAEKTPHNVLYMEWLGALFPRAKFVHVVRDARAVASSLVRQGWVDTQTGEPVWYCSDLTGAATYWVEVVTRAFRQSTRMPGRVLVVRYEDLVARPEQEMRRVFEFLDEPWDPAVLAHAEAGVRLSSTESSSEAVARPIHSEAVERWRSEMSDEQVREVEAIAGDLLAELGYEVASLV